MDLNRVGGANQVGTPFFERPNDCQEFLAVYLVVELDWGVLKKATGCRTPASSGCESSCRDVVRGISFHYDWRLPVKVPQDGRGGEGSLQFSECRLLVGAPYEWRILLSVVRGDHESSVEIPKIPECP